MRGRWTPYGGCCDRSLVYALRAWLPHGSCGLQLLCQPGVRPGLTISLGLSTTHHHHTPSYHSLLTPPLRTAKCTAHHDHTMAVASLAVRRGCSCSSRRVASDGRVSVSAGSRCSLCRCVAVSLILCDDGDVTARIPHLGGLFAVCRDTMAWLQGFS